MPMQPDLVSRFNVTISIDGEMPSSWVKALECQLEIVEKASLHPRVIDVIRKTPLIILPMSEFGARYRVNSGVEVGTLEMPSDRPVILHELMHAFHHSVVQDGFANADISEFYERAVRFKIYPASSYVMRSVQEFFAITATALAHGEIKRPPYTRDNLKNKQPNYYRWLSHLLQRPVAGAPSDEGMIA